MWFLLVGFLCWGCFKWGVVVEKNSSSGFVELLKEFVAGVRSLLFLTSNPKNFEDKVLTVDPPDNGKPCTTFLDLRFLDSALRTVSDGSAEDSAQRMPQVALVACNQQLPHFTRGLLKLAGRNFVCADGGGNRYMEYIRNYFPNATRDDSGWGAELPLPEAVLGDLDSLLPENREFYRSHGVHVEMIPEQITNDMEKAVDWIINRGFISENETVPGSPKITSRRDFLSNDVILVIGALGGRMDQTIRNLHYLYKMATEKDSPKVVLIDDDSLCYVHPPGKSQLRLPEKFVTNCCGILPLVPCKVTTWGIRWNLNNCPMAMGSLVSSSNEVAGKDRVVRAESDFGVLWSSEVSRFDSVGTQI